jgi:hypothetical protein
MLLESLAPVHKVSVIWACVAAYLDMSLDRRLIVPPEFQKARTFLGLESSRCQYLWKIQIFPLL